MQFSAYRAREKRNGRISCTWTDAHTLIQECHCVELLWSDAHWRRVDQSDRGVIVPSINERNSTDMQLFYENNDEKIRNPV